MDWHVRDAWGRGRFGRAGGREGKAGVDSWNVLCGLRNGGAGLDGLDYGLDAGENSHIDLLLPRVPRLGVRWRALGRVSTRYPDR